MVLVLEADTGFLLTKKGRKDIFDLGVNCIKNWSDDLDPCKIKSQALAEGKALVDERLRIEEAERKEAQRKAEGGDE